MIADRGRVELLNGLPTSARSMISTRSGNDAVTLGDGPSAIIAGGGDDD
ncbi:MAG: hypothetical protein R3C05_12280 [Pirellulaceae bacterium]